MKRATPKESEIQKAILDYLTLRRVFHYRNNSGAFVDSNKHFYRFGALASPDIICIVKGQYVGLGPMAIAAISGWSFAFVRMARSGMRSLWQPRYGKKVRIWRAAAERQVGYGALRMSASCFDYRWGYRFCLLRA